MTDKQIIIGGVDVSGCEYFCCSGSRYCNATVDSYGDASMKCDEYEMQNCYYKQLKRAEAQIAEYEELQCQMREKIEELEGYNLQLQSINNLKNMVLRENKKKET